MALENEVIEVYRYALRGLLSDEAREMYDGQGIRVIDGTEVKVWYAPDMLSYTKARVAD